MMKPQKKAHHFGIRCIAVFAASAFCLALSACKGTDDGATYADLAEAATDYVSIADLDSLTSYGVGLIGAFDRDDSDDTLVRHPIPGLYYRSCMDFCAKDTCYSNRIFVALRCPKERVLLDWVADYVAGFTGASQEGYTISADKPVARKPRMRNARQICDHYVDLYKKNISGRPCDNDKECHNTPNEQNVLLITDILQTRSFCTFFVHTNFDFLSCGCNYRYDFQTIDKNTGKELGINDFVESYDSTAFKAFVAEYYDGIYGKDRLIPGNMRETPFTGCALTKEGLMVYYAPYTVGCGADGVVMVQIPYDELAKNGFKLK